MDEKTDRSIELCRRVVTTESFIEEARVVYGNQYDYSKVNYKNCEKRVVVICPVHGDFLIYAREHLDGKGCPKCAKGEKFISKLKKKFGDKFILDNFVYESSTDPVELICPEHGVFRRIPGQILQSPYGCPMCGLAVNQKAHEEAVARKEVEKAAKEQERQNEIKKRLAGIEEYIRQKKTAVIRCLELDCEEFAGYPSFIYGDIVDQFIEVIRYNAKWMEEYRQQYLVTDEETQLILEDKYEENDLMYRFIGYAAPKELIEDYEKHCKFRGFTFEESLARRNCHVIFKGDDLYILYRKEMCENVGDVMSPVGESPAQPKDNNLELPTSFVAVDFETLYAQRVSACSIGMVKYKDSKIVDRFYTPIRPPFDYPGKCGSAITWIHGFTEDMLKDERTFAQILPQVETFIEGLPLVAHNASVERACFRDCLAYYGLSANFDYEGILDTLPMSRRIEKSKGINAEGPGMHSLDAVCRRFGVTELRHHNALDDAEMCGNLLLAFSHEEINIQEKDTIASKSVSHHQKYNTEDKVQRTDLENVVDNPFKDKVVVLTGFAVSVSQDYAHKLNELGAIIKTGVNKKTNILITGYNAGPAKLQKAQELGVKVIPEEEFLKMIENK